MRLDAQYVNNEAGTPADSTALPIAMIGISACPGGSLATNLYQFFRFGFTGLFEAEAQVLAARHMISAVCLRLITSSYLVGACTGRSAGLTPLRMRFP
jgi:hypothetical protein